MANKLPWLIFMAFVITKLLWNGFSKPLVNVHWDNVAHLYQAKQFSDTAFIKHHAQQASAIAAQVYGHSPSEPGFSGPYWCFSRLGLIVLLGTVVKIFGSGEEAIVAAHWLFNILMALNMVLAVALVIALVNYLDIDRSRQVVLWSAVVSSVLYMISNIYAYMGRCLVSEIPAMLLLTVAILLLIMGLNRRSVFLSCCSGVFAFLAYSVRLESIWLYIAFCAVLATMRWIMRGRTQWFLAYAFAGSISFVCYLLYAWYFYPLANPYLFIIYAKSQPLWKGGVPFYKNISVAGGLLWTGVFASIIAASRWTTARMALAWAGAALLPLVPYLMQNLVLSPPYRVMLQTRMLVVILFLPLLLSSTLGWAYLWEYRKRYLHSIFFAVASLTVLLIALSSWTISKRLSILPDLWKIQYVHTFLTVPPSEQNTYRFDELNRISQVIYNKNNPAFLVFDSDSIKEGNLTLVRFFGPAYPPQANFVIMSDPTDPVRCEERIPAPPSLEKVSYCTEMPTDKLQQLTEQGITVFLLTPSINHGTMMPFGYAEVLRTQNYRLGIIEPL
jgi:hypothetical protein